MTILAATCWPQIPPEVARAAEAGGLAHPAPVDFIRFAAEQVQPLLG